MQEEYELKKQRECSNITNLGERKIYALSKYNIPSRTHSCLA